MPNETCPECIKDCAECSSPGVWEDMHAELVELREENAKLKALNTQLNTDYSNISWQLHPEGG